MGKSTEKIKNTKGEKSHFIANINCVSFAKAKINIRSDLAYY